jgi:hypothetical protein
VSRSSIPGWARPRETERRGLGSLRLAETTVLILVGVLLATATIDDVVKQARVNVRLSSDLRSWRAATGHDYRNLTISRDVKSLTTRDTVCGNVSPGGPKERAQLCLTLVGPVIGGERAISGGFYLPPKSENELPHRYACFGVPSRAHLCGLGTPPAGSPPAPPLKSGLP